MSHLKTVVKPTEHKLPIASCVVVVSVNLEDVSVKNVIFDELSDMVTSMMPSDGTYRIWLGDLRGLGTSGAKYISDFEGKVQSFGADDLHPFAHLPPEQPTICGIDVLESIAKTPGVYPCGVKTFAWVGMEHFMSPKHSVLEKLRAAGYFYVFFPGTVFLENADLDNQPYMLTYQLTKEGVWKPTLWMVGDDQDHSAVFLVYKPKHGDGS